MGSPLVDAPPGLGPAVRMLRAVTALGAAISAQTETTAILTSLVTIGGEALGVDRALIYQVKQSAASVIGLVEWLNPKSPGLTPTVATYPLEYFEPVRARLAARPGAFVSHAPTPDPLLVGTGAASLLHGDMKIQSLLWWPFHGGPDGFMVLVLNQVTHRREWTDADLGFVEALGELVTLTLEKTERLTALHAAEQRATEASVRYRRLYDNTPSMFFTLDRGGVVRSTNRFACRSLGFSEDELIGAPVELVLHPDDVEAFRRQLSRCLERPSELATQEYRKRRKDGTEVWVRESMQAYRADDGDEVLVVCDDVTAEKRSTEALIRAQSLESIGLLAAQVAHDFNNVLMAVLAHADLARMRLPHDSPARHHIEAITAAGHVARDLAKRVLAFSGRASIQRVHIDLDARVREVVGLISPSLPSHVPVILALESRGATLVADPAQLDQVIVNLVVNAAEAVVASAHAEGAVTVRTAASDDGASVVLEVSDTGKGMSHEIREKIFDPLFTTKAGGHGLGLAAVSGVVRAHRGTIEVESTEDVGTVFRVKLPRTLYTGRPDSGVSAPISRHLHILVVDEDRMVRSVVAAALDSLGHEAILCGSFAQALETARARADVDCVVLDPAESGASASELARAIRAIHPGMPIIIMSGSPDAKTLGPTDVVDVVSLAKPFVVSELESAVARAAG